MDEDIPPAKRPRLSMACNACRRRKVKCDADYPKCRNCRVRDDVCTVTDPKMPHVPVTREWIVQTESVHADLSPSRAIVGRGLAQASRHSPGSLSTVGIPNVSQPPENSFVGSNPWNHDVGISPVQQQYDVAFNTDTRTDRIKMMGGSSSQCLMKSLDVYLESARILPLSHNFRYGMREAEEMDIPLEATLPALPETILRNRYASVYFDQIHTVYPIFNVDSMRSTIQHLASLPKFQSLPHEQGPLLVSTYLVLSVGADEDAKAITADGTKYLVAAASLLGHIILMPYLHAVQALLLFTIAYRGRNKDGLGWQTLGMAIRIAHSLGLHRHSCEVPAKQHNVQTKYDKLFHARIWAVCCSLENLMQLESGRPATIRHVDRDHMMGPDQWSPGHDFLKWHMGLAQHQGLICQHIYGHSPGERTSQEILSDTARLDRSLLSWASSIPEEFRPGNDLFCSNEEFHIAALLSIQHFQALIALHRAALIAPLATFQLEVGKYSFDESSKRRLLAGETICASSARSIARLTIELSDRNVQSRILNGGPPLMACIVLGISLIKNTGSRSTAADLELLKACVEYTAAQFSKSGHNDFFIGGVLSIYQSIRSHVDRSSQADPSQRAESLPKPIDEGSHQASFLQLQGNVPNVRLLSETTQHDQNVNLNHPTTASTNSRNPEDHVVSFPYNNSINPEMAAPVINGPAPHLHTNAGRLPFGNLDVQELWDWMGNLSDYDNYSYQGA